MENPDSVQAETPQEQAQEQTSDDTQAESMSEKTADQVEQQILEQIYTTQLARYHANKQAAADMIQHGEYPVPSDLAVPQLAAWSTVANVLLNLDETITRE